MGTVWRIAVMALVAGLAAVTAQDGAALSVRLVTASEGTQAVDTRLRDVLPLLQNTLRFSAFKLESETSMSLRSGGTVTLAKGYDLRLADVQGSSATVTVSHQGKRRLETRLAFKADSPVVVGGFDEPDGAKAIIILKLR